MAGSLPDTQNSQLASTPHRALTIQQPGDQCYEHSPKEDNTHTAWSRVYRNKCRCVWTRAVPAQAARCDAFPKSPPTKPGDACHQLVPKIQRGAQPPGGTEAFSVYWKSRNKPPLHNFWVPRCSNTVDPSPRRHMFPEGPWDSLQQAEASTRGVPVQPPWIEAWVSPACLTRFPEAHSGGRHGSRPSFPCAFHKHGTCGEGPSWSTSAFSGRVSTGPGRWEERAEAPS